MMLPSNIPKNNIDSFSTFCPAKWDELFVNLNANFVYACCKATPVKFVSKNEIGAALDKQKNNLLNGVQDPGCDYCWKIENQGFSSRRHQYLKQNVNIDDYYNNPKAKKVEISLGNHCNFQCTYCNPKFSSQWETDVRNEPYKLFRDRYFYAVEEHPPTDVYEKIEWLKQYNNVETLSITGGEPLQNKHFFTVIENIPSKELGFVTNLSCKTVDPIDKILKLSPNYNSMRITVSLDSTDANAEFSRYGLNYNLFLKNLTYLLENAPTNVSVFLNSVMTSVTIRDIEKFSKVVERFKTYKSFNSWLLEYCKEPKILSLDTLPDKYKPKILEVLDDLKNKKWIIGVDQLKGAVLSSTFNNTLAQQLKHFLIEFSQRKNISIPIELE